MRYFVGILVSIALHFMLSGAAIATEKPVKPKVRSVSFSGNITYTNSRLEGLMLTRPSRFLATNRFHLEVFQDDLETLISFYKQNGFLQAQILDTSISIDSLQERVDIAIQLDEGSRTFVEGVTIFGNTAFSDSILMSYLRIKSEDPLRRPAIEDAVVTVLALYAEHGFLDASVIPNVRVNDSAHLALIDIIIKEKTSSRIGKISIAGAVRSRPNVILRELTFSQGDTTRYSRLIDSQRRLYLTGLFESAFIRPLPSPSAETEEREIIIEVKEKPSSELSFSIGYGSVEKFRGRAELSTSNLSGTARKAGFAAEANFIKQSVSLSFSEPWTLGTRWRTDLLAFGQLQQEPSYHAETVGGRLTVGRKLRTHTAISLSYRLENTNLSRVDLEAPIAELDPRIRSMAFVVSHDSRNNLFDPSSGWYVSWSNEVAGSFLQGSDTFAKSILTIRRFQPYGRNTVIASSMELGWMDTFGESREIPISERFYTGGPTSLRGFGYQMVGPVDANGEPLGGRFKLVCNLLEVRRSIYRMIGGVLFIDLGNVWAKSDKVQVSDLRVDLGAGLRVNSPIGIVRLDYGINMDRRGDEPRSRLIFSMGQAF